MKKRTKPAGKSHSFSKNRGIPQGRRNGPKDEGRSHAPRPLNFRQAFAILWKQIFSSPVHLDSVLSKAPPSLKSSLAIMSRLLLRRPSSLAHFLHFRLAEGEPFELGMEDLENWSTAQAMADRLFQYWKRDPDFWRQGIASPQDYPLFMVDEWRRDFGDKVAKYLVQTMGEEPSLSIRASRRKGRDEVLSALNDSKELPIRARSSQISPIGFTFDEYVAVLGHPLFKDGQYEIQDEGSQVMSLFALWPKTFLPLLRKVPGQCRSFPKDLEIPKLPGTVSVVDACAGAGGKSLAMADLLFGKGQVFAYDVSEKKLESLRKRAKRSQLTNIKTLKIDDTKEDLGLGKYLNSADRVLVDAPCSGWGTIRRNPDLKWRQRFETLENLEKLQARLLEAYSPLVKKGGILTYGVCTFRPAETTIMVENFSKAHPEFRAIGGGYLGPGPSDGFYFHAWEKV